MHITCDQCSPSKRRRFLTPHAVGASAAGSNLAQSAKRLDAGIPRKAPHCGDRGFRNRHGSKMREPSQILLLPTETTSLHGNPRSQALCSQTVSAEELSPNDNIGKVQVFGRLSASRRRGCLSGLACISPCSGFYEYADFSGHHYLGLSKASSLTCCGPAWQGSIESSQRRKQNGEWISRSLLTRNVRVVDCDETMLVRYRARARGVHSCRPRCCSETRVRSEDFEEARCCGRYHFAADPVRPATCPVFPRRPTFTLHHGNAAQFPDSFIARHLWQSS